MHRSSYDHMTDLVGRYLSGRPGGTVVDIGSQDVNGSYRPIFDAAGWHYIGCDAAAGANVDVVAPTPYRYPFATDTMDLVVSGQAFEHVEFFWAAFLDMARIMKPGGLMFLIAPSRGPEHRFPVDCWRFYPDGYRALARWGGMALIEVSTDWQPAPDPESALWGDTVGVFQKHQAGNRARLQRMLASALMRLSLRLVDRTAALEQTKGRSGCTVQPSGPRKTQAPASVVFR